MSASARLMQLSPMRSMVSSVDDQAANFDYYLDRSTDALVELLGEKHIDLFCYVNSVTDWIAHKFWRFSDPGTRPRTSRTPSPAAPRWWIRSTRRSTRRSGASSTRRPTTHSS